MVKHPIHTLSIASRNNLMWFSNLRLWSCNNCILFCRLSLFCPEYRGGGLDCSLVVRSGDWRGSGGRTGKLGRCRELDGVRYAADCGIGSELDFVFGSTSLS